MNKKAKIHGASLDLSRKGAFRVAEIVDAAAELLLIEGFSAVNKRKIAAKLGISDGNVSYYFPTRESLWSAVIEFEINDYYQCHQASFASESNDIQACFDDYVMTWIDEYKDRMVRIFFSQILTFAEVDNVVAKYRDEIYEAFFEQTIMRAKPLVPNVKKRELEQRVLAAIALLEGLHMVTAFRPKAIKPDNKFKHRLLAYVNAIIRGDGVGKVGL